MTDILLNLIRKYAKKYKLDPAVVYGICQIESDFNQYAERYEPNYNYLEDIPSNKPKGCSSQTERMFQKTSIGIMQVMGGVYRQYGLSRVWRGEILSNIDIQFDYGCKHLKNKIRQYGKCLGVLAYNTGNPRQENDGRYFNQEYLEKVILAAVEYPSVFCKVYKGIASI